MNKYLVAKAYDFWKITNSEFVVEVVDTIDDFSPDLVAFPEIEQIEANNKKEAFNEYVKKHKLSDVVLADY